MLIVRNEALKRIKNSRQTIALTGAGISTASGIPDFRGTHGLWKSFDPAVYANIRTFRDDPEKVWGLALKLLGIAHESEPNSAHLALALMQREGLLHGIITQNIDNLHQRAGSRYVINYHGSVESAVCMECGNTITVSGDKPPLCGNCGIIMKPGFTLFGEAVPPAAFLEAKNLASFSDVFMVIGTSAVVQPAADLPVIAKEKGAFIIELNRSETGLTNYITDCFIRGAVEETLPVLVNELK